MESRTHLHLSDFVRQRVIGIEDNEVVANVDLLPVILLSGRDANVQNEAMDEHSRANPLRCPLQTRANGQIP